MTRRSCLRASLGGLPLLLSSCGYHAGGKADLVPKNVQTVAIPAFLTDTSRYKLVDSLPQAIATEFLTRTRFRVVNDPSQADAVLRGSIIGANAYPNVIDPQSGVSISLRVVVILAVRLIESRTGKTLYSRSNWAVQAGLCCRCQSRTNYSMRAGLPSIALIATSPAMLLVALWRIFDPRPIHCQGGQTAARRPLTCFSARKAINVNSAAKPCSRAFFPPNHAPVASRRSISKTARLRRFWTMHALYLSSLPTVSSGSAAPNWPCPAASLPPRPTKPAKTVSPLNRSSPPI